MHREDTESTEDTRRCMEDWLRRTQGIVRLLTDLRQVGYDPTTVQRQALLSTAISDECIRDWPTTTSYEGGHV